jgi:PST family polysaccharide transporter
MYVEADSHRQKVQKQLLGATALIAGSSVISIFFSIARTKAVALLLGPSGVGLISLYTSIADLAQSAAGMGIQGSGVRQIAEAAGTGDTGRIARTAHVLRRSSLLLGLIGAALLIAFSAPFSSLTFGSTEEAGGVALLGAAVFLRVVSGGQAALLQGMRRIGDLARISVLGAFFSMLFSVVLIFAFGRQGIVLSLIAMAAASGGVSWYYSAKLPIERPRLTWSQIRHEGTALLTLGVSFMASGFLSIGAAYAVRVIVQWSEGVEAAGLYQSAWTIGGLYAGFVLQAMGTDFYPRLTAVCRNDAECTRLVNDQTYISLLLAGPGVIATLTFAPVVLQLFYSSEFQSAVVILRFVCLGMMFRIAAWPIGFVVVAKGARRTMIWTEVAATIVHVGLAWVLVKRFGVNGAGAAFCALYVFYTILIYLIVRRLSGFRWSAANRRLALLLVVVAAFVFCAVTFLPPLIGGFVGGAAAVVIGIYCMRSLFGLLPAVSFPARLRNWFAVVEPEGS